MVVLRSDQTAGKKVQFELKNVKQITARVTIIPVETEIEVEVI